MIIGIDPGPQVSHLVAWDGESIQSIISYTNAELLREIDETDFALRWKTKNIVLIEMISSYGMQVGSDVFETCVFIGRLQEALKYALVECFRVYRKTISAHHCGTANAGDRFVKQALADRFAPGVAHFGRGTKKVPGFFDGFSDHHYAAFGLAVYGYDVPKNQWKVVPDADGL